MTIRFSVPVPPSVNNLYPTAGARRVKSSAYRGWLRAAFWLAIKDLGGGEHQGIIGSVSVTLMVGIDRRSDIDGRVKAILDLLVSLRIIEDDRWVDRLLVTRGGGKDMMEVTVEALAGE